MRKAYDLRHMVWDDDPHYGGSYVVGERYVVVASNWTQAKKAVKHLTLGPPARSCDDWYDLDTQGTPVFAEEMPS